MKSVILKSILILSLISAMTTNQAHAGGGDHGAGNVVSPFPGQTQQGQQQQQQQQQQKQHSLYSDTHIITNDDLPKLDEVFNRGCDQGSFISGLVYSAINNQPMIYVTGPAAQKLAASEMSLGGAITSLPEDSQNQTPGRIFVNGTRSLCVINSIHSAACLLSLDPAIHPLLMQQQQCQQESHH
jgi:hypothetical protein